uniref:ATP synthase mitochondrial F1 complex assembly factor 1 n=1 Tax=Podarcis muralis TaxID=64176 RepID=A0A670IKJ2_PODMU
MAAGHLQQLWWGAAGLGLSRGALVGRFAALRPLGLLLPPQPRLLAVSVRGAAGGGGLEANPFFAKYQGKIQELRRSNPEIFESRLDQRSEVKKQPVGDSKQAEFVRLMEEKLMYSFLLSFLPSFLFFQIWKQYYSGEDTVYAVIPVSTVNTQQCERCRFLYPLPRKEGYEFFVGHWSGPELHFTSLINVQSRGESAPTQLVLYHYPELQEEKGIVLMTGEMDPRFLTVTEAQCLASQVQLFYATDSEETYRLVEEFNHRPNEFKYMSVIGELEQSRLGEELSSGAAASD